ncbi:DUF4148 domain-containing protein [Paraburkholderia sp. C35]|uniref:DUF4148 domain-containing protein n=1 Tax=Paraburkholderia sp. C35 TaxID=2126993 RepID=UPI000D68F27E|nr:DUF4148 domain-containing protein [Paraburkholderia sp. C35]
MLSESNRMFVAGGLLIGTLVLGALGLQFGNRLSSAKEADARVDSALSSTARPVMPDASSDDRRNAGIARVLQAVHDSLQRGDLASAHLLLDAVLTMRSDEPQALLLKKELAAREEKARNDKDRVALASVPDDRNATPPAQHAKAAVKTTPTHARAVPSRRVNQVPSTRAVTTNDTTPSVDLRSNATTGNATTTAPAVVNTPLLQPHVQPPETASAAPLQTAAAPTVPSAQTATPPSSSSSEPASRESSAPPVFAATGGGPKTRAEVRDELNRARSNGTMSRFGNPDPYGPGGAPSHSDQPSARPL